MLQPENTSKNYETIFVEIDTGIIKIPKFQRDFVWGKEQTAKLIDSIIKGFPIGTFIFWRTKEQMRHFRNIGDANLPSTPRGNAALYVLDGQQRLTSLYAARKGLIATKEGKRIDFKELTIDLSLAPDDDETVVFTEKQDGESFITVYELINAGMSYLVENYTKEDIHKIETYRNRLTQYNFSCIVIPEHPLDIACEIFTRINTGGTELSLFEIMVAKTYDEKKKFDFANEYDKLVDSNGSEKDLEDAGYETIPTSTVLQCVSAQLCKQVRRKDILKLNKNKFIKEWPIVKDGIFHAVDYFRNHLRIPVSRLLPYPALLVPFTYFFIRNGGEGPTRIQKKLLVQYFWWASLSNRFTSGAEGKMAADIKRMDRILKETEPNYKGDEYEITIDDLQGCSFSAGEAFCKAIICLFAYFQPKSFDSDSLVTLGNSWLKQANSKNYHHFFPKSYLKKMGWENQEANCILNITLVNADLNKRKIRAKSPSKYMKQFKRSNNNLNETMKSHLINDLDAFGVWTDDYKTFIEKRGKQVLKEITKRLKPVI